MFIFTNSFDTLPTTVKTTVKLNGIKKKKTASVGMKIKSAVRSRCAFEERKGRRKRMAERGKTTVPSPYSDSR